MPSADMDLPVSASTAVMAAPSSRYERAVSTAFAPRMPIAVAAVSAIPIGPPSTPATPAPARFSPAIALSVFVAFTPSVESLGAALAALEPRIIMPPPASLALLPNCPIAVAALAPKMPEAAADLMASMEAPKTAAIAEAPASAVTSAPRPIAPVEMTFPMSVPTNSRAQSRRSPAPFSTSVRIGPQSAIASKPAP